MPQTPRFRAFSFKGQTLLLALFLIALWLGGLHAFTRGLDIPPATPEQQADAIVVLTGGSSRLEAGFDLLERGLAEKLFISGVYQGVEVRELLALLREQEGGKQGLEDRVVLGFEANDTMGNAYETIGWMRQQGYTSLYLVTANYHMRRSLLEFRQVAPGMRIYAVPVIPEGLDMANWWRNHAHRNLIIREYMKFLLAHVRALLNAFLKV
jgi:uncharacterized SAM-binding protein YcdF (DUF218 family)